MKPIASHLSALLLMSCITLPAISHAGDLHLPELGSESLTIYDSTKEKELGDAFRLSLHTQFELSDDYETIDYIQTLGRKIVAETGINRNFEFYVIKNPTINAFAGPNGIIGIHTGLIKAVKSEDELASVIAHEIAHVTQNHLSRQFNYQQGVGTVGQFATLLASILIGMQDPNAGMGVYLGGMSYNLETMLKNSRQHEFEADSIGIEYLAKAGYEPFAMADFFGRLYEESRYDEFQVPEILRTHPMSDSRLVQSQHRANILQKNEKRTPLSMLELIQLRNHFPTNAAKTIEHCFENFASEQKANKVSIETTQCLIDISKHSAKHTIFINAALEHLTELANRNLLNADSKNLIQSDTQPLLEYYDAIYPTQLSYHLRKADFLMSMGENKKALESLQQFPEPKKLNYLLNRKLAETANANHLEADAYYYRTLEELSISNFKRARYFIEQSEKIAIKQKNENILNEILMLKQRFPVLSNKKDRKHNDLSAT